MKPGILLATIGLPRSGKSTMCQNIYMNKGYAVVNPDSFRLAIHGKRYLASAELHVWASVFTAIDGLLLAGNNVIVDATNTNRVRRWPLVERGVQFIVVNTPKEECLRRAVAVHDDEIIPIIRRMNADYEEPGPGESVLEVIEWEPSATPWMEK
jgi:predicted kinase